MKRRSEITGLVKDFSRLVRLEETRVTYIDPA